MTPGDLLAVADISPVSILSAITAAIGTSAGLIVAFATRSRGAVEGYADLTKALQTERDALSMALTAEKRWSSHLETLCRLHGIPTGIEERKAE